MSHWLYSTQASNLPLLHISPLIPSLLQLWVNAQSHRLFHIILTIHSSAVTPTYYVLFTLCTLVTSVILYQGLKASAEQILTIAFAFLIICSGIFLLQMSKVDPTRLTHAAVDRKTSILLQAAREEVGTGHSGDHLERGDGALDVNEYDEKEKAIEATEEPGLDALAGRFGGLGGTLVRARRRATIAGHVHERHRRRRATNQSMATVSSNSNLALQGSSDQDTKKREEGRRELKDEVPSSIIEYPALPHTFTSTPQPYSLEASPTSNDVDIRVARDTTASNGPPGQPLMTSLGMLSTTSGFANSPLGTPASEGGRMDTADAKSHGGEAGLPTVLSPAPVPATNTSVPTLHLPSTSSLQHNVSGPISVTGHPRGSQDISKTLLKEDVTSSSSVLGAERRSLKGL